MKRPPERRRDDPRASALLELAGGAGGGSRGLMLGRPPLSPGGPPPEPLCAATKARPAPVLSREAAPDERRLAGAHSGGEVGGLDAEAGQPKRPLFETPPAR